MPCATKTTTKKESQTVKGHLYRMAQVAEKMIADALDSHQS